MLPVQRDAIAEDPNIQYFLRMSAAVATEAELYRSSVDKEPPSTVTLLARGCIFKGTFVHIGSWCLVVVYSSGCPVPVSLGYIVAVYLRWADVILSCNLQFSNI